MRARLRLPRAQPRGMRGARAHVRDNVIAYLALFIALGGTSYAATQLPRNSVGSREIRAGAVGSSELDRSAVRSSDVEDGALRLRDFRAGELPAGPAGPGGPAGPPGPTGPPGAPGDLSTSPLGGDLSGTLPNPTLATQPAVRVDDDTQVELDSAQFALLDLDDEAFDTASMHPANGDDSRIRLPRAGTYVLAAEVEWAPEPEGFRTISIVLPTEGPDPVATSLVQPRDSPIQATIQQVTAIVRVAQGTQAALLAGQGSGVPLEVVRATLSAAFVSP